jgi:putative ABC transport system permease protein
MKPFQSQQNSFGMYKNFLKIGWRNLLGDKGYSVVNIGGLALGLAIAILIGLWVNDELTFNKQQENYSTVAAVMQHNLVDGSIETWSSQSYQLGPELRENFGNYFKYVVMSSFPASSILTHEDKALMLWEHLWRLMAPRYCRCSW